MSLQVLETAEGKKVALLLLLTLVWLQLTGCAALVDWETPSSMERPGCHLLGHSGAISIPGCSQFSVTTNGCRGWCPSVSLPAPPAAPRPVTSLAHCCSISAARPLTVSLLCLEGTRNLTIMSATACSCYHCHKD